MTVTISRAKARLRSSLALFLLVSSSSSVWAQASADEKAAAEALFDDGKRLMIEGEFGPACEKLEQSQRIDPAVGTLLYLGECYEKSGRTASAWATFREASSAARASGQAERARIGQDRAARLESRLVRLTIKVASENAAIEGFALKRNGEMIGKALWGVAIPVDPGEQVVEAAAPGYQPATQKTAIDRQPVSVSIPPLAKLAGEPTAATPAPTPPASSPDVGSVAPATTSAFSTSDRPPPANLQRTIGITLGALGVVGLGLGAFFGLKAISNNKEAEKHCPRGTKCEDPEGPSLAEEASHAAVASNITFAAGGVILATGAFIFLTAPSKPRTGVVRVMPIAGPRELGAAVGGSF
ncbi:MAG TPA: hypothetical protein VJT73_01205 [Polyangiaceae bacterium]|nr:hypothetical protein [Polyangiaceae bacterium]